MKRHLSILGILMVILLSGCSSDSSSRTSIVDGQWKLVRVSGSIAGISSDFTPGIITWTFNPTTQMVTVVNNNTDANLTDLLETGVYNYQIVASENPDMCSEAIKIDNMDMGCFSIVDGGLVIDQSVLDGYKLELVH